MEVHVAPLDTAGATFAAALMAGEPLAQAAAVEGLALAETLAALLAVPNIESELMQLLALAENCSLAVGKERQA